MCSSTTCSLSPIIVVSQLTKDGFTPRDMRRWGKKADLKHKTLNWPLKGTKAQRGAVWRKKNCRIPKPEKKQKAGDLGLSNAYNSAIDDSSKLHLLSPQAVQVQGQAFKQALVTQLQQSGPKSTVCGQHRRTECWYLAALSIQRAPSLWLSQPLTCAVHHMSSNAVKLLLEKFQVCSDDVHTWLNLHQRLREKTQEDPQIRNPDRLGVREAAAGTTATLTTVRKGAAVKGILTKLSRTYSSSPVINAWVAVCGRVEIAQVRTNPTPQDMSPSSPSKPRASAGAVTALGKA